MASISDSSEKGPKRRDTPAGILRLDIGRPRRLSAEFQYQGEPTSPQPSIDRLSVTFAEDSVRSDSSTRINYFNPAPTIEEAMQISQNENPEQDSDQEDYSASVNAIIQRRASTKKSRRRRASSPFSPDVLPGTENGRRRSSVYTTSSGDTAITMDENLAAEATQEEIFENIKLHKEVLSNVKMQPWNMRKKLKLVVQAKAYIKKHEGALQERLAQSHSTKDILARWNILFIKKWQRWKRETLNLSMWFIPWELKIKEIESHFGSVVASYFIFLRWLFWVNIVIAVVLVSFVTIPEMLVANSTAAGDRKKILEEDRYNSTNFMTLWEFEGVFKYSPIFYGWYTNDDNYKGYRLPLAYFMTGLVVYAYSFFAILRKMAENSRMSKLSEKDDECIFSWKLFTGWDYMIGNAETAHNRVASIVMGFKEALLEEAEKKKDTRNWKIICCRMLVNTVIMGLLSFSGFVVVMLVERSRQPDANSTFWRKNETSIIISLITSGFPILFEILGFLEQYHPRKQLRLQLARIMVLNLLNLYSLIFALFVQIDKMTARLEGYKNITEAFNKSSTSTEVSYIWSRMCTLNCSVTLQNESIIYNYTDISNLIDTITTTALPKLHQIISNATMESSNTELEMTSTIFPEENFTGYSNYTMTDTSIVDLKNAFVDYLTYILNSVVSDVNETYVGNSTIFPLNENETYNISTIDEYETFKTTVLPTFLYDDSTTTSMEEELSSLYNDITTDITTFKESLTDQTTSVVEYKYEDCVKNCEDITFPNIMDKLITTFNYTSKKDLRSLCWETMYGQELIKLTVMDLIMTIVSALAIDFVRGIFVRVMNRCWCWDLERSFPQYGDFKVAENILSLVNNQGMVWMGMFFSPGLVPLNVFKLYIMMYFRSWAVLTCNVPHEVIFRASRSNNFYYALLLMMLFLCVLPVGYAIVWIKPSWHCGPFSTYHRIFHIFTKTIRNTVPFHRVLDYIASPGIVIPLLVLLILIIYYLVSLTAALREANEELKVQLRRERTEERRKMFQLADRRRRGGSGESNEFSNTPYNKWKKLLGNLPSGKSLDDTPKQETDEVPESVKIETKSKDFFSKLIKRALRKSSTSEDEHNVEDGTDTEQHDSLPDDPAPKPSRPSFTWGASDFQAIAHKTLQLARSRRSSSSSPRELEETTTKGPAEESKQMEESKPPAGVIQKEERQDSESSVWSDNIPVIKISKTESSEDILEAGTKAARPKLRATLRKQSTEIDEDALEGKFEEVLTDRSSSESTDHKGSVETILNAPIKKKEE